MVIAAITEGSPRLALVETGLWVSVVAAGLGGLIGARSAISGVACGLAARLPDA